MNNPSPTETIVTPSRWQRVPAALRNPLVLIVVALLAVTVFLWLGTEATMEKFRSDLARRFSDVDSVARESRTLARQNQETLAALQAKVGVLEAGVAQAQSQQVSLDAMYQELLRSRDERLLAEIEQSLVIAAQQLQLAGNVEAALIALQDADARLAHAAQPQFLPLRKLIARDIDRLRALPGSDLSGVILKLEGAIASIDSLPMAFERRPKAPESKSARKGAAVEASIITRLMSDFWSELSQLVRIQRIDQSDPGVLAPNETFFLRENLKLRLVNARLSLLARDGSSFHEDLRQGQVWLERYFDTQARPVQTVVTTLKSLNGYDIVQGLPSLNETLASVRNFRLPRSKG